MEVPSVSGTRLGVVHGHSLPAGVTIEVADVVALPRHGPSHEVPAHLLDHHANIRRLCELGCDRVVALASCGSLRTDWLPGSVVCPDDFLAPNVAPSFFDDTRGHSIPGFDGAWRASVVKTWNAEAGLPLIDGGVYAQTSGPRFETPAEVRMLARDADLVGMTIAAEAILAHEAGLSYAAVCTVDNLGNGLDAEPLTVEEYRAARDALAPKLHDALGRVLPGLAATPRPSG